ncbi:MAG TPA: transaldolase family protein [Gemmatimonadaceae bacterium]|nr:transaldolase family protein [Gemmatimonadaceae bacterium]
MRIFLATTSIDEIRWAADCGLIDGVVATPTIIATEAPQADARDVLADIARATRLPICASVHAVAANDIVKGARDLRKVSERMIVAIPFIDDAIPAIRRITTDGIPVAATLVYSAAQGILAAHAGAAMVTISTDALDAVGSDGTAVLRELRSGFDHGAAECDIAAAGPGSAASFAAAAAAGADVAIVTTDVLRSLLQHPLTDRGLDRFLGAIMRRPKGKRAK